MYWSWIIGTLLWRPWWLHAGNASSLPWGLWTYLTRDSLITWQHSIESSLIVPCDTDVVHLRKKKHRVTAAMVWSRTTFRLKDFYGYEWLIPRSWRHLTCSHVVRNRYFFLLDTATCSHMINTQTRPDVFLKSVFKLHAVVIVCPREQCLQWITRGTRLIQEIQAALGNQTRMTVSAIPWDSTIGGFLGLRFSRGEQATSNGHFSRLPGTDASLGHTPFCAVYLKVRMTTEGGLTRGGKRVLLPRQPARSLLQVTPC